MTAIDGTAFVPGLELSHRYFDEVVEPSLDEVWPGLNYAAGLIGDGSEVQGFDTARSADHDWGPRVQLFVADDAITHVRAALPALVRRLPREFLGCTTHFHRGDSTEASGPWRWGEITRGVEIHSVAAWSQAHLGMDATAALATSDWLSLPWTLLRGASGGAVWRDDSGTLTRLRASLQWYPDEVWRYVLACQWQRVNQEEPFVGRTAEAGYELGSRIVAARLTRDLMHLCFLIERRYPPYAKWLEAGFRELACAHALTPHMMAATTAIDAPEREAALGAICEHVAAMQNDLGMGETQDPALQQFHDRPFRVLNSYRFVDAIRASIDDATLRGAGLHGCISQCVDSTDVLASGAEARNFVPVLARGIARDRG